MLIRFKKPDPRAGMVADMDSSLGREFVEQGIAEAFEEKAEQKAPENKAITEMENKAEMAAPRRGRK